MSYIISPNPHIKHPRTTRRIMLDVCIALLPAVIAGCVFFGLSAFLTILLSVLAAVVTECALALPLLHKGKPIERLKKFWKTFDFTSVVTGILLALCLPAGLPWYMPLLGGVFGVGIAKMLFGGTGKNFVNPALAGRIFLFLSFTAVTACNIPANIGPLFADEGALSTGATQLGNLLNGEPTLSLFDLFLGTGVAGCIGETCKLAILLGGLYLVLRGVITWWYPVLYLVVAGVTSAILGGDIGLFLPSLLSGGIMLGAVFMATDYVTSPKSRLGNVIYYIFLGILTAALRRASGIEVVSFCILIGNVVTPLLDSLIPVRPFGYRKKRKEAAK